MFFIAYYATHGRSRLWICLLASYVFYAWWDWRFLLLIAGMTGVNFYIGLKMEATYTSSARRRLLGLSIVSCIAVLGFFKYFNFFTSSVV
ncbi:MAG TPA: hypothetical protein PLV25_05160, partial [Opitutales bacterium]|nr:hypothetical protein [Opitutales bacterium]